MVLTKISIFKMMEDNTNWTPAPDENKLGLLDKNLINQFEAKGIATAELFVFQLESDTQISTKLLLKIHHIAFAELYDWAGFWRTTIVTVGQLIPPNPNQILHLMYQFIDNLNFRIKHATTLEDHLDCMVFAHYEFIRIHPFNNGNGRTGRILMNIIALKLGYRPLELYHREGNSRKVYIDAMKLADNGNYIALKDLIRKELYLF